MRKILIVDDDLELTSMMKDILRNQDFEVVAANDGLQAINASKRDKMDLILLDVRMPFFSGFWFCDAFKQRPETRNIPVLFVSALGGEDNVQKAYNLGACGFLKKPFLPEELIEAVDGALN